MVTTIIKTESWNIYLYTTMMTHKLKHTSYQLVSSNLATVSVMFCICYFYHYYFIYLLLTVFLVEMIIIIIMKMLNVNNNVLIKNEWKQKHSHILCLTSAQVSITQKQGTKSLDHTGKQWDKFINLIMESERISGSCPVFDINRTTPYIPTILCHISPVPFYHNKQICILDRKSVV